MTCLIFLPESDKMKNRVDKPTDSVHGSAVYSKRVYTYYLRCM